MSTVFVPAVCVGRYVTNLTFSPFPSCKVRILGSSNTRRFCLPIIPYNTNLIELNTKTYIGHRQTTCPTAAAKAQALSGESTVDSPALPTTHSTHSLEAWSNKVLTPCFPPCMVLEVRTKIRSSVRSGQ